MTDRPTRAEARQDAFWARPADEISGTHELRIDELADIAGISENVTGRLWTGTVESIMEQWADITYQEGDPDGTESTPRPSTNPDSSRVAVSVVAPVSDSKGPDSPDMTRSEAISRLTSMYTVAAHTAVTRIGPHYAELAEAIHEAVKSIMSGVDAESVLQDLAFGLRDDADYIPDEKLAALNREWANMAEATT